MHTYGCGWAFGFGWARKATRASWATREGGNRTPQPPSEMGETFLSARCACALRILFFPSFVVDFSHYLRRGRRMEERKGEECLWGKYIWRFQVCWSSGILYLSTLPIATNSINIVWFKSILSFTLVRLQYFHVRLLSNVRKRILYPCIELVIEEM